MNFFHFMLILLLSDWHCTENHIFFFQTSWNDGLSKKIALEYDLSRIIGKDHVFLSRNMILTLGGKWKMIFFKKIQGNMIFSSGLPKRRSFQKGPRRDMIFLVLSGKMVFFFPKARYFFLGQKASDDLSQEIHENMIFSVYTCRCYKPGVTPPSQKQWRMALSRKNKPKGDWRSRLASWKELHQFSVPSQGPLRAFSCIALQRKKQET